MFQKKRKPLDLVALRPKFVYCQKVIKIMGFMGRNNTIFFYFSSQGRPFILWLLSFFFFLKPQEKNSALHRGKKKKSWKKERPPKRPIMQSSLIENCHLGSFESTTTILWLAGFENYLKEVFTKFLVVSSISSSSSFPSLITGVITIMLSSAILITHLCIFLDACSFPL